MKQYSPLDSSCVRQAYACFPAAVLAVLVLTLCWATPTHAAPGDQWVLPVDHMDGGFYVWPGSGYSGPYAYQSAYSTNDAYEGFGKDPVRRIYWALNGISQVTSNTFPRTTQLYLLEWYVPLSPYQDWQPIESQFEGSGGEVWPVDPAIPWVGEYGQNHQWIAAQGDANGDTGVWLSTGPGPHTPQSSAYNCLGDNGLYMWLRQGSWLYAKWDFTFDIDHTWSALRLTQVTPVVILSVTNVSHNINLTWSTIPGYNYQLEYTTNLVNPNWNSVGGSLAAGAYSLSASDINPPDAHRFYRVVQQ